MSAAEVSAKQRSRHASLSFGGLHWQMIRSWAAAGAQSSSLSSPAQATPRCLDRTHLRTRRRLATTAALSCLSTPPPRPPPSCPALSVGGGEKLRSACCSGGLDFLSVALSVDLSVALSVGEDDPRASLPELLVSCTSVFCRPCDMALVGLRLVAGGRRTDPILRKTKASSSSQVPSQASTWPRCAAERDSRPRSAACSAACSAANRSARQSGCSPSIVSA
mmetsp:Transcript_41689/g.94105  ORF Transcript_41689/g.94105 Transcript_41689/m.94105 type:complete len:221 (-) Transcript_41689:861-1523(-)